MTELKAWLDKNKLGKIYNKIKEEVDSVEDFKELEDVDEVSEFVNDLKINKIEKKKFIKAICVFANIQQKPKAPMQQASDEQKEGEFKEPEPGNISQRVMFPDGINVVPFEQRMYKVPVLKLNQYAFKGGSGFSNNDVEIETTVNEGTWNQTKSFVANMADNVGSTVASGLHAVGSFFTGKSAANKSNKHNKHNKAQPIKDRSKIRRRNVSKRPPQKLFADDKHKIILICGKTGAGKSTLINSMMNYIYNVQYDDKFRLRLIEEQKKSGGDADSCTDHISSYRIKAPKGGQINYDLTIVDTPGFGDCRGVTKDMQILEEFKYVFDKILTNVNGICFVVKSADNRLDAAQTYVFNNILNLWAKDVKNNIFILMTFADGKRANCIDALNKNDVFKKCKRRYKINNSAFTDDPLDKDFDSMDQFDKLFWDMGMTCFDKFFRGLEQVEPQPIAKSKEVLRQRDSIQTQIYHLSKNLDNTLRKQQTMHTTKTFIESKRAEIDAGKEVVWYEDDSKWVTQPSSNNLITTCTRHQKSCHPGCCVSDKNSCCMMNSDKYCTVCSCPASSHINASYEYVLKQSKVRKSNWDTDSNLKTKHNTAKNAVSNSQNMIRRLQKELRDIEKSIMNKIAVTQSLRNQLEQIALRPQLSTVGDYIDQLIENENESQYRDAAKIKMLKELKAHESVILKLQENGTLSAKDFMLFNEK